MAGVRVSVKAFTVLIIIFVLILSGTLIFLKGFLLSRTVIEKKSNCKEDFALRGDEHQNLGFNGCWMHGRFKKGIIIIIDAMKYDFMVYNSSLSNQTKVPPFKNKLKTIHSLLHNEPLNSRLYRFMADPPTTTMQRLKGLTTGSLPTFVDAGSNFQSNEITEDNFVDQIVSSGKKILFLGDDTWQGLYPNRFFKSFPFPSFDVKDLDSVDNGILKNFFPQIKQAKWDVTIAHFLGVDHCGHRYGPNHPEMARKLTQMDDFLRYLVFIFIN